MKQYSFYDALADHDITVTAKDFWSACAQLYRDFGGVYFYHWIRYNDNEPF